MNARSILVWSERPELAAELAAAARALVVPRGWDLAQLEIAASMAAGPAAPVSAGGDADTLYRATGIELDERERLVHAVSAAAGAASAGVIVVGATKLGLEIAPRVAERLGAGYAAWVTGLEVSDSESVTARCTTYAGSALTTIVFKPGPVVVTAAPGALVSGADQPVPARELRVVDIDVPARARSGEVLRSRPKAAAVGMEHARVVVDVGQGIRERSDLEMIEDLASILGASIGCSRPIAAERDWFPDWLGLSGAKVGPDLCIAIGVSGAVQHVVGIRASRVIAAVNSDESAAIFSQADVGVVSDLYAFVPALVERLRARRILVAGG